MLVGNQVDEGLTWSIIGPTLPSLFLVKGASKYRPHSSEPLVMRTGQLPWLRPGLNILPIEPAFSSVNVNFTHMLPYYYRERRVEPCRRYGEVVRCSSWTIELIGQINLLGQINLQELC